MADNHVLNTRIKLKYDSYENWIAKDPVLLAGEVAIATVATNDAEGKPGFQNLPNVVIKVGDGSSKYSALKFVSALAADVHGWAKEANKPVYTAAEIEGIKDYIDGIIDGTDEIQDTNTTYVFTYTDNKVKIQSKEKGQTDPKDFLDVIEFTIDDSAKITKVASATAGNLPALTSDGSLVDSGEKIGDFLKSADAEATYATIEDLGAVEEDLSDLSGRVDALDTATTGRVSVLEAKVDVLNGEATVEGSVKKQVVDAIASVVAKAPEDFDTLKEIADWIANDQTGAASLANRVSAVEKTVGEQGEAIAALEEVALSGTASLEVLNAITAEDVAAWDAAEKNAKDYADGLAKTEKEAREALDGRVTTAEGKITTLEGIVGLTENDGLQGAVAGLEELSHDHDNKTTLDGITDAKVTAWDAAVQSISGIEVTKAEGSTEAVVTGVPVALVKNTDHEFFIDAGNATGFNA
jgi:hypothetical protein